MTSFTMQLDQFKFKSVQQAKTTIRWIVLELCRRVIMKTPVDTGRARSSWTPALGSIPSRIPSENDTDKKGTTTVMKAKGVVDAWDMQPAFFLVSNLPYIMTLEYGRYPNPPKAGSKTVGGFSKQAPQGMVRITLAEFQGIVATAPTKR